MLKQAAGKRRGNRLLIAPGVGVLVSALTAILCAWAWNSGAVPAGKAEAFSWISLVVGAAAVGLTLPGRGKSGLTAGGAFCLCYLLWKLAVSTADFLSPRTLLAAGICAVIPWLISCIFHRNGKTNTKRNHRKRART